MLARVWKKVGLAILILACLFNIVSKLVSKTSLKHELQETAEYVYTEQKSENMTNGTGENNEIAK
ncbi:MAG: hypothetical protein ACLU8F_02765 [Clostridia bacterium]